MPSQSQMLALLGLLAVAGYQNRDRLGAMIGGVTGAAGDGKTDSTGSGGGLLGSLQNTLGGGASGGGILGGLSELVDRFTGQGHGDVAKSWVETGPNREPTTGQLETVLGGDTIQALTQRTGLSREELLSRLTKVLPTAVDKMTPEGRLPTESEASGWLKSAST